MKTALITGAAQGLGFVSASLMARSGYRVILADLQDLEAAAKRLRGEGATVEVARGDVASEAYVRELARTVERGHGALDVLVNNAGISLIKPAEDTTADEWQKVMSVNLLGPFLLCKYLGAQMLARRAGSIVNVASVAGLAGVIHRGAYTDADITDRIPMARFARPDDVAQAIVFLADNEKSSFVNGASLTVDGEDRRWQLGRSAPAYTRLSP